MRTVVVVVTVTLNNIISGNFYRFCCEATCLLDGFPPYKNKAPCEYDRYYFACASSLYTLIIMNSVSSSSSSKDDGVA